MARGGARQPPARTPPAGPGKFSRRDERSQPIREPDIDSPGLEYGDRQMLTEAQRIAGVPKARQGSAAAPRPTGMPTRSGGLPPWLLNMPTQFPEEPATAGLPMGPGPGPEALQLQQPPDDVREMTMMYLSNHFGNADARMVLEQFRSERAAAAVPAPAPGGASRPAPVASTMMRPPAGPRTAPAAEQAPTGEAETPTEETAPTEEVEPAAAPPPPEQAP